VKGKKPQGVAVTLTASMKTSHRDEENKSKGKRQKAKSKMYSLIFAF
jgi:hypothetical protein